MKKPHLIMACLSGSHLYGTSRPDSDIDIRGVCWPPESALLGLQGFDQFLPNGSAAQEYSEDVFGVESDDVTIYALRKFFALCLKANPNIIELLFVPASKMLHVMPAWVEIDKHRHLFLSTKIVHTFAGYAYSQLSRIERHHKWLADPPEKPDPHQYGLYSDESGGQKWHDNDQANVYRKLHKRWKEYDAWRKNRNPKRAALEARHGYDVKHGAHLHRLVLEAEELLKTGRLTLPLLPEIRDAYYEVLNGGVEYEAVVEYGRLAKERLQAFEEASVLPKRPDHAGAEKLLMRLHRQWLEVARQEQ